jgi:hypothetical protein
MMEFQKKSALAKIILKFGNRRKYVHYKKALHEQKQYEFMRAEVESLAATLEKCKDESCLNVVHSGNAGDIVYALPTLRLIQKLSGKSMALYLKLDQPHRLGPQYSHPLGDVMLNRRMAEMLLPLLRSQPYIDHAAIHRNEPVHFDFDKFRRAGMMLDRGDVARWYGLVAGVSPQSHLPWLQVQPDTGFSGSIVVSRSERYRNVLLDYSILDRYDDVVFVGVESEYKLMCAVLPRIRWVQVSDFRKLAAIIAGSSLFIGNQSFAYSIAEALKQPRILEVFWQSPNVMPSGENGHDVMFQPHFQAAIHALYEARRRLPPALRR